MRYVILFITIVSLTISNILCAEECSCKKDGKPSNPKYECCGDEEFNPEWTTGGSFQFALHSGVISQVNNTLNRIPNVNITLNTVRLGYTSYKKSKCCNNNLQQDAATASEGNVRLSAQLSKLQIWGAPSITKKYDLGDGDYLSLEFTAGVVLSSNFSIGTKMGERRDTCDAGLNYLYGNLGASCRITASAEGTAKACYTCSALGSSTNPCVICADFSIVPAALSITVSANANIGTKDSKGSLPTGAVSMSRLVYSAVLKVGSFSARYEYTIME